MQWFETIIKYWAQIAVLLASIGYILKVIFDFRYKKKEIGYSLFTKEKIIAVSQFVKIYTSSVNEFGRTLAEARTDLQYDKVINFQVTCDTYAKNFTDSFVQLRLFFPSEHLTDIMDAVKRFEIATLNYIEANTLMVKSNSNLEKAKDLINAGNISLDAGMKDLNKFLDILRKDIAY